MEQVARTIACLDIAVYILIMTLQNDSTSPSNVSVVAPFNERDFTPVCLRHSNAFGIY